MGRSKALAMWMVQWLWENSFKAADGYCWLGRYSAWLQRWNSIESLWTIQLIHVFFFSGDNVDCWMEIQHGKGPWAPPVSGIVPLGSTLTLVVAINDFRGLKREIIFATSISNNFLNLCRWIWHASEILRCVWRCWSCY